MKKTLSMLAVLGVVGVSGFALQSADAFTWSNLNPATWFNSSCPKCQKVKKDCGCQKDPCATGYAAPCDPCAKKKPCEKKEKCKPCQAIPQRNCDPCDQLQNMNR